MSTLTIAEPDTGTLTAQMTDLNTELRTQGVRMMSLWLLRHFFGETLVPASDTALELSVESRDSFAEQWRHALNVAHELGYEDAAAWLTGPGGALLYNQTAAHRGKCLSLPHDAPNVISLDDFRHRRRRHRQPVPVGGATA